MSCAPKDGSGGAGVALRAEKVVYRHGAEKLRKQEIACVTRIGVSRWNDIAEGRSHQAVRGSRAKRTRRTTIMARLAEIQKLSNAAPQDECPADAQMPRYMRCK